jgi:hypothetical protein
VPLSFKNDDSTQNRIISDVPSFGFLDLNKDNLDEFYVDNRNYEKDPTLDIFRSYYYFREGIFVYDHTEEIHLAGN